MKIVNVYSVHSMLLVLGNDCFCFTCMIYLAPHCERGCFKRQMMEMNGKLSKATQ